MTMDKSTIKAVFGLIIFMFSLALAYFSASYMDSEQVFDYWAALSLFAGAYVLVGLAVLNVFPVSLGFLFSADILILHLMTENFSEIGEVMRMGVVGAVLILLYAYAWEYLGDKPLPAMGEAPPASPTPPVPPVQTTSV